MTHHRARVALPSSRSHLHFPKLVSCLTYLLGCQCTDHELILPLSKHLKGSSEEFHYPKQRIQLTCFLGPQPGPVALGLQHTWSLSPFLHLPLLISDQHLYFCGLSLHFGGTRRQSVVNFKMCFVSLTSLAGTWWSLSNSSFASKDLS